MLHAPELLDAIEALIRPEPLEIECWRQTIGNREPLFPNSRGARWNPPGIDALYCALSEDGAAREVAHLFEAEPVLSSLPRKMSRISVRLRQVADLRNDALSPSVGVVEENLLADDWKSSAPVGAAAAWLGLGGLLVPSARHGDGNLVVFVNNLDPDDLVEVVATTKQG